MIPGPHRIRRLRWSIRVDSSAAAFGLRQRLRAEWQDRFLPAIESAFNQAAPAEEILRLPKIELHLKTTSEQQLIEALPEAVLRQLVEQLQEILQNLPDPKLRSKSAEFKRRRQDQFENLLRYLRTGSVDWVVANAPTGEVARQFKETCHQQRDKLRDFMQRHPESAAFYFRLFQLATGSEGTAWARTASQSLARPWKEPVLALIQWLLEAQHAGSRHFRLELAAAFLAEALAHRESEAPPDLASLAQPLLQNNEARRAVPPDLLSDDLGAERAAPPGAASLAPGEEAPIPGGTLKPAPEPQPKAMVPSGPDTPGQQTSLHDNAGLFNRLLAGAPLEAGLLFQHKERAIDSTDPDESGHGRAARGAPESLQPPASSQLPDDRPLLPGQLSGGSAPRTARENAFPLLVTHAGLILLHPFFPPLFENTRLKEPNPLPLSCHPTHRTDHSSPSDSLSPSVLPRAAALLYFLAAGQDEPFEYELPFIKVLLGLLPSTTVCVASGLLSPDDQREAGAVLESVIHYWTVLKSTSIAGLRGSFLNRQALLRDEAPGWRLQVERLGYDVLLDHLPWSIRVVKLPWMPRPLTVEW